ncbi:sensor histidine kinase [Aliarcobacter cryaerophilus]|uniref:sensor histidine kinase n=1 Tax=Aliarcobacter cryaerophilus TaxID=28198 RepID=UPI001D18ED2C|nr:HAMP domain-containing sensor histidine kinase [Aliarcobacter cryaerophilus]
MFKNNNIEIVCDIDKNIVLNSYLNELQQVILNILKNAKDALIENDIKSPYIKIEAKVDEKNIYLSITDNAGGIKTEPINKIFEAYFTTKPQSQGTGIGLYMSKMILEKSMKGKLFVENIEDKARFTIKL